MTDAKAAIQTCEDHMNKAVEHLEHELTKIRAGAANPGMLDTVRVDYYGSMVSTFGLESQSVQSQLANQEILVEHVRNFRESIIGVNLDEELVSMIQFEKAFGANARVLTTVNELMGIVVLLGRY